MLWTPWEIETLKKLYKENKSYSEIGKVIGKSRCAVGGQVFRLGLTKRGVTMNKNKPRKRDKGLGPKPPTIEAHDKWKEPVRPKPKPVPIKTFIPVIKPLPERPSIRINPIVGVSLMDLEEQQCHCVVSEGGTPGSAKYCGEPTVANSDWCETHHAKFHMNVPKKTSRNNSFYLVNRTTHAR